MVLAPSSIGVEKSAMRPRYRGGVRGCDDGEDSRPNPVLTWVPGTLGVCGRRDEERVGQPGVVQRYEGIVAGDGEWTGPSDVDQRLRLASTEREAHSKSLRCNFGPQRLPSSPYSIGTYFRSRPKEHPTRRLRKTNLAASLLLYGRTHSDPNTIRFVMQYTKVLQQNGPETENHERVSNLVVE